MQSLTVNGERVDMRPWPLGRALGGADVGKWVPGGQGCSSRCLFGVGGELQAGVGVSCGGLCLRHLVTCP